MPPVNLFEYQAKSLLVDAGLPAPVGTTARTEPELAAALGRVPTPWVLKAQIKAGGRGKVGGVKITSDTAEATDMFKRLIGRPLVTKQTGPAGQMVHRISVEPATIPKREFYFSILVDRGQGCPIVVASAEGGMEIERLAEEAPEKILKMPFDLRTGLQPFQAREIAKFLGLTGPLFGEGVKLFIGLARFFAQRDCSMLEINPLAVTPDDHLLLMDAKVSIDDNAVDRQPDIAALAGETGEDPREAEAAEHGLSYIALDGSVGCMVNGAGLAMATLDILKLHGAMPANFLDVGGSATRETVTAAFKILLADPKVKVVMVNIFGGIMKCDVIAQGMVEAFREIKPTVPVVVRLEGTNKDAGVRILAESGLALKTAAGFDEAAKLAAQLALGKA